MKRKSSIRMKCCRALQIGMAMGLLLTTAVASLAAPKAVPMDKTLLAELKKLPYRIVHETYRDKRWSLVTVNADGSNPTVLTRTDGANEMYPHVSPDGKKISFVCNEGKGWNICMADATKTNRWVAITTDGKSNKEPDWAPVAKTKNGRGHARPQERAHTTVTVVTCPIGPEGYCLLGFLATDTSCCLAGFF